MSPVKRALLGDTVQLQFWHPDKRAYVPDSSCEPIGTAAHTRLLDIGRQSGRSWRVAKAGRELTVARHRRTALTRGVRSIADVQEDYLRWAQAHGLKSVHAYADRPPAVQAFRNGMRGRVALGAVFYTGQFAWITEEEQFRVGVIHATDSSAASSTSVSL